MKIILKIKEELKKPILKSKVYLKNNRLNLLNNFMNNYFKIKNYLLKEIFFNSFKVESSS